MLREAERSEQSLARKSLKRMSLRTTITLILAVGMTPQGWT